MEIVAGVGQMNCHHIVKCVSVHLVVFAAMSMVANELLQWLLDTADSAEYCRILQNTAGLIPGYCRFCRILQDTAGYSEYC